MGLVDHTVANLIIFVLAACINHHTAWTATPVLHTPLMAVTNAILTVIIADAIPAAGPTQMGLSRTMDVATVALTAVSVFGGFPVIQRMLEMFKKKEPKAKGGRDEGAER